MITFDKVSKTVELANGEPLTLIQPTSLHISAGESVSIVGPSGSGKSTLLSLAAGLDVPTSGKILAAGVDLTGSSDDVRAQYRARSVGIVFQSFHLFSHLNAVENVRIAAQLAGESAAESEQKARRCLEAVQLGHRMQHFPPRLSGGEKQRVAIARALINEPELLLCDEPTGNLDRHNAEKIFELLLELSNSRNTTLVLVTHDNQLAQRTARMLTLEGGEIVSDAANPTGHS